MQNADDLSEAEEVLVRGSGFGIGWSGLPWDDVRGLDDCFGGDDGQELGDLTRYLGDLVRYCGDLARYFRGWNLRHSNIYR